MRGSSSEIRQQLRNQTLDGLLTTTIGTVGGRIFPDDLAVLDLDALNQIVKSWQSTHVPTYGQVLPNSGANDDSITDGYTIGANDNEVIEIIACHIVNGGGSDPITVQFSIGPAIAKYVTIDAGGIATSADIGLFPLVLSSPNDLQIDVVEGSGGDLVGKIAYQYRSK